MKPFWLPEKGKMTKVKNQLSAIPNCEPDGRLSRLIGQGIVRPGRAALPRALFTDQPPRPNPGASALETLLEERRKGRWNSGVHFRRIGAMSW
jgi:hypothetical protein